MLKYEKEHLKRAIQLSVAVIILTAVILSLIYDYVVFHLISTAAISNEVIRKTLFLSNIIMFSTLLFAVASAYFVFRIIIKKKLADPLYKLQEGIRQVREGNLDYRIPYEERNDLYELYEDFNEMIAETQRLAVKTSEIERGRKELLMDISHDIRSPLTAIIAYVQGLLDGVAQTPEAEERYLVTIKEKSIDIKKMVDRLFLYAKLDNSPYLGEPELLFINKEIQELLAVVQPEYQSRGLSISFEEKGNGYIFADSDIFRRVCMNIIENSCKYKDKEHGHLIIQMKEERQNLRITFRDDGPGIPSDTLSHIWDVFYRGDQSRSNPHEGSGIGLAIVKKAVENMGGKIFAANNDRGGLIISIRIPKMEGSNGKNTHYRR